jgi:hypothetical protein
MEFTPASESVKSMQSTKYQSAAVVRVHDSKLNSVCDEDCSRSMRYAALTYVHNNKFLLHSL